MMGLCYKDLLVQRKQLLYYAAFMAVYAMLVVGGIFDSSILPGLLVLVGVMLPMSSFAYDDLARWDKYAAATPAGRKGVVAGKYLFALVVLVASAVLVAAVQLLLFLLHLIDGDLSTMLLPVPLCALMTLFLNAVLLPLLFKFGAEKSRIITMALFVSVFGGIFLLARLVSSDVSFSALPPWFILSIPVLLVLIPVGCFVISYFISRGIYEKKEL